VIPIQGFGKNATGGAGYPVLTVTNPAPSGTGSYASVVGDWRSNATVVFAPGLPYFSTPGARYIRSNVTIDGLANGNNGIEHRIMTDYDKAALKVNIPSNPITPVATNVIVRGINFRGRYPTGAEDDLFGINGSAGTCSNVLIERCTFNGATDGAIDLTGSMRDITIQACLFSHNTKTMLVKYGVKTNISLHHNISFTTPSGIRRSGETSRRSTSSTTSLF
jgi:pectate lyase